MTQPKLKLADELPVEVKKKDTTASVWNKGWKYAAAGTAVDLAAKFRRIRRQQALELEEQRKIKAVK